MAKTLLKTSFDSDSSDSDSLIDSEISDLSDREFNRTNFRFLHKKNNQKIKLIKKQSSDIKKLNQEINDFKQQINKMELENNRNKRFYFTFGLLLGLTIVIGIKTRDKLIDY